MPYAPPGLMLVATRLYLMAERVGFEPTVPLPRRMLSKHVDSSTLAPLHDRTTQRVASYHAGQWAAR